MGVCTPTFFFLLAEFRKVIHLPGRGIIRRDLLGLVFSRQMKRTYFGFSTTPTLGLHREKTTTKNLSPALEGSQRSRGD